MPCVIGVTGGIASGKSTIARIFGSLGAKVIHADRVAHEILRNPDIRKRLVLAFGSGIQNRSGALIRRKLAHVAFANSANVRKLNRITHPAILKEIKRRLKRALSSWTHRAVVLDVPLLFESGLHRICDYTVFVDASLKTRLDRAQKRGLEASELLRRERFQGELPSKKKRADFVLDNNHSRMEARKQVRKILAHIRTH